MIRPLPVIHRLVQAHPGLTCTEARSADNTRKYACTGEECTWTLRNPDDERVAARNLWAEHVATDITLALSQLPEQPVHLDSVEKFNKTTDALAFLRHVISNLTDTLTTHHIRADYDTKKHYCLDLECDWTYKFGHPTAANVSYQQHITAAVALTLAEVNP